jgi:hypothetical protein
MLYHTGKNNNHSDHTITYCRCWSALAGLCLPPIQIIQSQLTNLTLQQTWTWAAKACYSMPGLSFSSTTQWLPRAVFATLPTTDSLLWFFSAHSSWLIPSWIRHEVRRSAHVLPQCQAASSTNLPILSNLYLCRAENVLGRVPMMLCFEGGNFCPCYVTL